MYVFAATTAVVFWRGQRIRLQRDQIWPADDPLVKSRPDLFVDRPQIVQSSGVTVESASAEPGEKRPVQRVKKT